MKILNAMFGSGQGGIEQAFIDYCDALVLAGHQVHGLIHPDAAIKPALEARKIPFRPLENFGAWDPIAIWKIKSLLKSLQPDVAIAHGNRAVSLLRYTNVKLIAPLHNYKIKCRKLAAVFCPTQDLFKYAKDLGLASERIYFVPNMVRVPIIAAERTLHNPPVIGSMGRFVTKKGFDVFIEALAILKAQGLVFKAVLAGDGSEAMKLKMLAAAKGVSDSLVFAGWAQDKQKFFDSIDIFCLPSHHEPFGIVLLEAMAQRLPVVSTASEGPSEIIEHRINGLITPRGDPAALADALAALLKDQGRANLLAKHAYETARGSFDLPVVSAKLDLALRSI